MLRPRLIPCLLLHNGGLYKTVNFGHPKYIGDPINAVRIFNEKEVDELIVIDIDASRLNKEPDYKLIAKIAAECRMPLCYGGGVKTAEAFERIIKLGVEKIALSSAAIDNPELIRTAASRLGSQSIVGVIDVKKVNIFGRYEVLTINATAKTGMNPVSVSNDLQRLGVGEILINSVDNDGKMEGYDFKLIDKIFEEISTPLTVLGGAGSLEHVKNLFDRYGVIGAAAGSLFVFKGRYRAVLINYPNQDEKTKLYR